MLAATAASFWLPLILPACVMGKVLREDNGPLSRRLNLPVYEWRDNDSSPRAIVVAIHGYIQHGLTFDAVARELASRGFHVVALDQRGSGRWLTGDGFPQSDKTDCRQSEEDLVALLRTLKADYPSLPVIGMGESLGACFIIHVAVREPQLMRGAILASPAIRATRKLYVKGTFEALLSLLRPGRRVNISSYFEKYTGSDQRVIDEKLSDPVVRKAVMVSEVLDVNRWNRGTLKLARRMPPGLPVLIMQATSDPLLREKYIRKLIWILDSQDETIRRFEQEGHIFLQTRFFRPDAVAAVSEWLRSHTP